MQISRRSMLGMVLVGSVGTAALGPFSPRAHAADDPRMADRSLGAAQARVTVLEYFSLTCTHCAAFAQETFPDIKTKLIDTGKIRWVFRDFPLDQVALAAAMVARALPPARYEPFVLALLASQDRWAFNQQNDPLQELGKMAALAGMPHDLFQTTLDDTALKNAILAEQQAGETQYQVDSTPTFVINGKPTAGEMDFDSFNKLVVAASG